MKFTGLKVLPTVLYSLGALLGSQEVAASQSANQSTNQPTSFLASQEQVKQTIVDMINAVDSKHWNIAKSKFMPSVYADYSSLSGQPAATVKTEELVNGWQNLLTPVNTLHQLSNFDIRVQRNQAEAFSHVYASHTAKGVEGYWDVFGRYRHQLQKVEGEWKISSITLMTHGQKGNMNFFQDLAKAQEVSMQNISKDKGSAVKKVEFVSDGEKVVGNLYLPQNYDSAKAYPAVVVSGSWTTVKEQMAGLYAQKLANEGFVTLAFDFRNFGESEGAARFYENPKQKVVDIRNAVTFLQSLDNVHSDKIGALGICAGAMYTLIAASQDSRIKSVVTAASWLHDAEAVKLFYGGEQGVNDKIAVAQAAKTKYAQTGEIDYIPSISTTDTTAAMFGNYDYYLNPQRGAVPQWSADKFAVMTWEDWLTLDPMPTAEKLNTPTLMIHSDGAVLPQYTKQYFEKIATKDKALYWMDTELESPFHQFSFYDQPAEVDASISQASLWFSNKL